MIRKVATATTTSLEEQASQFLRLPYGRLVIPEPDGTYRGEIVEFPGCLSVGDTASEALARLEDAAESWLIIAIESGQPIPQPVESGNGFSGKLVLRFPKSLHRKVSWIAEREGVSLNQFIVTSLAEAVGERNVPRNVYLSFFQPADFSQFGRGVPKTMASVSNAVQFTQLELVR